MLFFEKLALLEPKWPLVPTLVLGTGTGYWAVLGTGSTDTGGVGKMHITAPEENCWKFWGERIDELAS